MPMETGSPESFFAPGETLSKMGFKEGDVVSLKVLSVDPDNGDFELSVASDKMEDSSEPDDLKPMLEDAFSEKGSY